MRLFTFISVVIMSQLAAGTPAPKAVVLKPQERSRIQAFEKKLKTHALQAKVKKTTVLKLLETTQISNGEIAISKSRLKLTLSGDENSKLVITPKLLQIEDPPGNFLKSTGKNSPARNSEITDLLIKGRVTEKFHSTGVIGEDYFFEPKKAGSTTLKRLILNFGKELADISKIRYFDELGNEVTYEFTDVRFKSKALPDSLFKMTIPKGASVTNLDSMP